MTGLLHLGGIILNNCMTVLDHQLPPTTPMNVERITINELDKPSEYKKCFNVHSQLNVLLFARTCQMRKNEADDHCRCNCSTPGCKLVRQLFAHLAECKSVGWHSCPYPCCVSARGNIGHWQQCKGDASCPLCSNLYKDMLTYAFSSKYEYFHADFGAAMLFPESAASYKQMVYVDREWEEHYLNNNNNNGRQQQ